MSEKINGYEIHPTASVLPLMPEAELRALAEDIKKNGQLHPVVVDSVTGRVVDGRNRLAACGLVGVEPLTKEETFVSDTEILRYVLSTNGNRRHMSKAARCIATRRVLNKNPDAIESLKLRFMRRTPEGPIEEEAFRLFEKVKKGKTKGSVSTADAYVAALVGCSPYTASYAIKVDRTDEEAGTGLMTGLLTLAAARKRLGYTSVGDGRAEKVRKLTAEVAELKEEMKRDPDPVAIQKAKERIQSLTKRQKELTTRVQELEAVSTLHQEVSSISVPRVPIGERPVAGRREATAVCVISDAHVEERVDLEETNGRNEYSPDICRARFEKLGQGLLWHLELFRSMYDIPSLVVPILGDIISGQIHDELIETNYLSQVPAIRLARDCIAQVLQRVLDETDMAQIIVPCIVGNHSRLTKKQHVKKAAENSFELVLYTELEDVFRDEPRVNFIIPPGKMAYLEVYDYVLRFVHGDQVRYNGGIGGVTVPLHKKIVGWDTERKADVTVMGHHHSFLPLPHALINGSVVGYNEYAKHIGARYEPPQQAFFLVDSKRGYRHATKIFVDSVDKER